MAITKASSSAVAPSAKGDLVVGSATNDSGVLAVGSTDQVLTVDSSTATGLKWATASAGGMTLIQETVASSNSSISFSSIPSTYKQLMIVWNGIYHNDGGTLFSLRFNNSSSAIYDGITHYNDASSSAGSVIGAYDTAGTYVASGADGGVFGNNTESSTPRNYNRGWFLIDNYSSTTKFKNYKTEFSHSKNVVYTPVFSYRSIGSWASTSAITSLDIVRISGTATLNNVSDTSIRLYGIS